MRGLLSHRLLSAAALAAAAAVSINHTYADQNHEHARSLKEAGEIMPLETLIERVRREHPGRLIEAELMRKDGRYVYELEFVDDAGEVLEFFYDASTGELVKSKTED